MINEFIWIVDGISIIDITFFCFMNFVSTKKMRCHRIMGSIWWFYVTFSIETEEIG